MEGLGSTRLARASSRYGSTAVFNGPVRKWKKKWVQVSPSPAASHQNSHSNANNGNTVSSTLLLCRWTPLSSSDSASAAADEPPKRKFRYTPVAVLEEERKRAVTKQVEDEAKQNQSNISPDWLSSKTDKLKMNNDLKKEKQDSSIGHLDLGLSLKGENVNLGSSGQQK